jgi:hypothetical protein
MYTPSFLHEDERHQEDEGIRSVHDHWKSNESRPEDGQYLEVEANIDDLRLIAPYKFELKKYLGDSARVVEFKNGFSANAVPDEWVFRVSPLLHKVKVKGSIGFFLEPDPKTIYFRSKEDVNVFLSEMRKPSNPGPSSADIQERRKNIKKFVG